jgi:transposase InsO family protein
MIFGKDKWLAQHVLEASASGYLVRDNDRAYGQVFTSRLRAMGIRDRPISPGSPWQNGIAKRLIGMLRRECLDRIFLFGKAEQEFSHPANAIDTAERSHHWLACIMFFDYDRFERLEGEDQK